MDIYGTQDHISATHDVILTYISYVGGCLSVLACLVTIATFQFFRLANDRVRIHQQLAAGCPAVHRAPRLSSGPPLRGEVHGF